MGLGDFGWKGLAGAVDADGGAAQRPELLDDVGDGQAAAFLNAVGDGEGGEHDCQVGFDGPDFYHRRGFGDFLKP